MGFRPKCFSLHQTHCRDSGNFEPLHWSPFSRDFSSSVIQSLPYQSIWFGQSESVAVVRVGSGALSSGVSCIVPSMMSPVHDVISQTRRSLIPVCHELLSSVVPSIMPSVRPGGARRQRPVGADRVREGGVQGQAAHPPEQPRHTAGPDSPPRAHDRAHVRRGAGRRLVPVESRSTPRHPGLSASLPPSRAPPASLPAASGPPASCAAGRSLVLPSCGTLEVAVAEYCQALPVQSPSRRSGGRERCCWQWSWCS